MARIDRRSPRGPAIVPGRRPAPSALWSCRPRHALVDVRNNWRRHREGGGAIAHRVRRDRLEVGLEREYGLYAWTGDTVACLLAGERLPIGS